MLRAEDGRSKREIPYLAALRSAAAGRHDIVELRSEIENCGFWEEEGGRSGTVTTMRVEVVEGGWDQRFSVRVTCGQALSCETRTLERTVLFLGVYERLVQDLARSFGRTSRAPGTPKSLGSGLRHFLGRLGEGLRAKRWGARTEVPYLAALRSTAAARHDLEGIRSEIEGRGFWEEEEEWRISTFTTKRVERRRGRRFAVVASCGQTLSCETGTLERAVVFLGVYEQLLKDLYWSLGWPGWVTGTQRDLHSSELSEIERNLSSGDSRRIRRAALRLGQFVEMDAGEAWPIWKRAEWWCRHSDPEVRNAMTNSVLTRLLTRDFKTFFRLIQEVAMSEPAFAETLRTCWQIPTGFPVPAQHRLALRRRLNELVDDYGEA